jgi:succinyl-diaminopimelate desuccinylase
MSFADPLPLAQDLIRAPSVTPTDAGVMDVLQSALETLGFSAKRYPFEEVDNLYARLGTQGPVLGFAGHVDVVPPGDDAAWTKGPFEARIEDGVLWGRGASDMKGALAAMVAAVERVQAVTDIPGSIVFLITGDEEGPAVNGTKKLMQALHAEGERFDHVLVGEPTNPHRMGETIKVGRRGSLNGVIRVVGRQGHVAYPERAENPIPKLMELLAELLERKLDDGVPHFQPSNLEVTSVDVGNDPHNVIPAEARAKFNIRFNTAHKGDELKRRIEDEAKALSVGFHGRIELDLKVTGEAFLSTPDHFTEALKTAVAAETGMTPAMNTGGGTSDARFIKDYAQVAEFGLVGATMHQVDEHVATADIEMLTRIYVRLIRSYFGLDT